MSELLSQNWGLILAALIIGIVVAWWLFAANRKTRVETSDRPDALDENAAPATRNHALIDAPAVAPQAAVPPPASQEMAGAPGSTGSDATGADDLSRIKGVGPKLKTLLGSLGVTSFEQIASWTPADIERIDAQLGNFQGRILRDNWTEQARLLASDDTSGFENQFGKI
jgi:predicted flap endonuclease-1-like 5' DNA nuclease